MRDPSRFLGKGLWVVNGSELEKGRKGLGTLKCLAKCFVQYLFILLHRHSIHVKYFINYLQLHITEPQLSWLK